MKDRITTAEFAALAARVCETLGVDPEGITHVTLNAESVEITGFHYDESGDKALGRAKDGFFWGGFAKWHATVDVTDQVDEDDPEDVENVEVSA